ncbi:MAG: hypothetical protein JSW07_16780 [bacterium]|nr:MAG: hypothetical protein JSW07_16780 [bacterium]
MEINVSNIKIYGPGLPYAIDRLTELVSNIGDLPILGGEITMGKYDFVFRWEESPKPEPLLSLVERIDNALTGLPSKYSITTEGSRTHRQTAELEREAVHTIFSFIRTFGPSISRAIRAIEEVIDEIETTNALPSLKSSLLIGKYDYAFEWDHWPSFDEIHAVLGAIDKQVAPTGALYTITTKKGIYRTDKLIDDPSSDSLMAFL